LKETGALCVQLPGIDRNALPVSQFLFLLILMLKHKQILAASRGDVRLLNDLLMEGPEGAA